jgi:hypothetical protein
MARSVRKSKRGWLGPAIFIAVVVVTGLVLQATEMTEDPIDSIVAVIEVNQMLQDTGNVTFPTIDLPTDDSVGLSDTTMPQRGERPDQDSSGSGLLAEIRWDEVGNVFYDVWYIAAATALVYLIGRPIGWFFKQIRPKRSVKAAKNA